MSDFYKTLSIDELYNFVKKTGLDGVEPVDVAEIRKLIPAGLRVLEVGCGTGRVGKKLIPNYDYVGIDDHKPYLDYFRSSLKAEGMSDKGLVDTSFENYKKKGFDAILFTWSVIMDFESKEKQLDVIKKAKSMLSKNGCIILDNPAKDSIVNTSDGYNPISFYYDEWVDIFDKLGFKHNVLPYKTLTGRKRDLTVLKI